MNCAILQARMSSTRLPGKVLHLIDGKPMLDYMLERVQAAQQIDKLVVATSNDDSDDPIMTLCQSLDIDCYRGDLHDVLDRYYQVAKQYDADVIIRLTGDCPLIDPAMVDTLVTNFLNGDYDYYANTIPPKWTVPEGMDVEVFSFSALEKAWYQATEKSDREHVTFLFWQNPELFRVGQFHLERDLSEYRLTVDYPSDLDVVKVVFSNLYPANPHFSMNDIVEFLKQNPEVSALNKEIKPNQGWNKPASEMLCL